jgi:hypothetical protein
MSRAQETVLLGALLERLGSAEAQVWLTRLDQWLSRDARDASPQNNKIIDRGQLGTPKVPYRSAKTERDGIPYLNSQTASFAPEERQL